MSDVVMVRNRWGRIPKPPAKQRGLGRGSLYKLAKKHPRLFRKYGAVTLVDLELLDQILDDLPAAELGAKDELPADTKEMVP